MEVSITVTKMGKHVRGLRCDQMAKGLYRTDLDVRGAAGRDVEQIYRDVATIRENETAFF